MPVKDDLGLQTRLGTPQVEAPWMPAPRVSARLPEGSTTAESVVRGLAAFNDGVQSILSKRVAEHDAARRQRETAAGKLAGFDPKAFTAAVSRGEMRESDSPYFNQARAEGAAEADTNALHANIAAAVTPDMTADQLQQLVQDKHDEIAKARGETDPIYAANMASGASQIHDSFATWLAGEHRSAAEEDAGLQYRRNIAQRIEQWTSGGKAGGVDQLRADLEAVDQHYTVGGLSPAKRANIAGQTLAGMIENTGDPDLAGARDMAIVGGGKLDELVGGAIVGAAHTVVRQAAVEAREQRAAAIQAQAQARDANEQEFYSWLAQNPNADVPPDLRAKTLDPRVGNPGLILHLAQTRDLAQSAAETGDDWARNAADVASGAKSQADVFAMRGHVSDGMWSELMKLADNVQKNGSVAERADFKTAWAQVQRSLPSYTPPEFQKGSEQDLGAQRDLEALKARAYGDFVTGFTSDFQANPQMNPAEAAKALQVRANEAVNRAKVQHDNVLAAHGLSSNFAPDVARDLAASKGLAKDGPEAFDAYMHYRHAKSAPKIPDKLLLNAVSVFTSQSGAHDAKVEAAWRQYQNTSGSLLSYEQYLMAILQFAQHPPVSQSATPSST